MLQSGQPSLALNRNYCGDVALARKPEALWAQVMQYHTKEVFDPLVPQVQAYVAAKAGIQKLNKDTTPKDKKMLYELSSKKQKVRDGLQAAVAADPLACARPLTRRGGSLLGALGRSAPLGALATRVGRRLELHLK